MQGAGLTIVSSKPHWWAADSGVLDVSSQHIDASGGTREHDGTIVLNPANPWLATRIDRYSDSNEIWQQWLEMDPNDCDTVSGHSGGCRAVARAHPGDGLWGAAAPRR